MEGYRKCNYCGDYFKKSEDDKQRYCSEDCHQKYLARQRSRHVWKSQRAEKCLQCGAELTKGKIRFCSEKCGTRYNRIKQGLCQTYEEHTNICAVCGKEYQTYKQGSCTCSNTCAKKLKNGRGRYYLKRIAERDGDICQICGLKVDWNDFVIKNGYIVCGNMYPSVDHIIPKSLGGSDDFENYQLAHRRCNSWKSNRYVG